MDITTSFIKIVLLMLPGAVSYKLFIIWTVGTEKYDYRSFINIFMFSVLDYILSAMVMSAWDHFLFYSCQIPIPTRPNPLLTLLTEDTTIDFWYLFLATVVGTLVAMVFGKIHNDDLLSKTGIKLHVASSNANLRTLEVFLYTDQWVGIHDHRLNVSYSCRVNEFSCDDYPIIELLLAEVSVYDADNQKLADIDKLFISRNVTEISIETLNPSGGENDAN